MRLVTHRNGDGHVVEVEGELTSTQLLERLPRTVEQLVEREAPPMVKVNLGQVEMVDLEGIVALMAAREHAVRSGARFRLVDLPPRVRERLRVTGLLNLLEDGVPDSTL